MESLNVIHVYEGVTTDKVENIVANEEFEQFLLLSQCFQKTSAADASESVFMREKV